MTTTPPTEMPKLLRNGAEPLRLSAKALASASYKETQEGSLLQYEREADWLADQVRQTYLKTVIGLIEEERR